MHVTPQNKTYAAESYKMQTVTEQRIWTDRIPLSPIQTGNNETIHLSHAILPY